MAPWDRYAFISANGRQFHVRRTGNRQDARLSQQSDEFAGGNHLRTLQKPLAGRVVLLLDQATSSCQAVLRYVRNAVKTQIWIAVSVNVLVAIARKKPNIDVYLHTLLQVLSLTLFEKRPLQLAFPGGNNTSERGWGWQPIQSIQYLSGQQWRGMTNKFAGIRNNWSSAKFGLYHVYRTNELSFLT